MSAKFQVDALSKVMQFANYASSYVQSPGEVLVYHGEINISVMCGT